MLLAGLLLSSAGRAQTPDFIDGPPPDPLLLPLSGAAGVFVGGLVGGGGALVLALAAQSATGEDATPEARTLNQLATFGTLVAPALLSVVGGVVGAGLGSGLVGAMTVGFGATVGAALGTGLALAVVPLGVGDAAGGALGTTAAIGGIVVGAAALGAAVAGLVAALAASGEREPAENLDSTAGDLDRDVPEADQAPAPNDPPKPDPKAPTDPMDDPTDPTDQGPTSDDGDADAVGSDGATLGTAAAHSRLTGGLIGHTTPLIKTTAGITQW